jgi:hypothetical protein
VVNDGDPGRGTHAIVQIEKIPSDDFNPKFLVAFFDLA